MRLHIFRLKPKDKLFENIQQNINENTSRLDVYWHVLAA